jgi:hypothetical protein
MEFAQCPCYKELVGELLGMFAHEKRLRFAVLPVVGAAGCLIDFTSLNELFGGVVFTFGCVLLLIENVSRAARARTLVSPTQGLVE